MGSKWLSGLGKAGSEKMKGNTYTNSYDGQVYTCIEFIDVLGAAA